MSPTDYTRKLATLDARIKLLQAQRVELLHKREVAKATPAKKREKPKKPSKKPAAK